MNLEYTLNTNYEYNYVYKNINTVYDYIIIKTNKPYLFYKYLYDKIIGYSDNTNIYINCNIFDSKSIIYNIYNLIDIDFTNCIFIKLDFGLTEGFIITECFNLMFNINNINNYINNIKEIYRYNNIYCITFE